MSDPCELGALELGALVARKEMSAEDITRAHLAKARESERWNAFLDLDDVSILASARAVDARLANGESLSRLAGVPVAIKDNICVKGRPATAGSRILAGWTAPYDATVIERLRAAGCVPFGKTNCDEFAMGSSNEHSAFGPVKNPRDESRVPGGSSGGSAAVVAGGVASLALGSDTGGSIRQPAAFCGVVGVKPTYGRVSRQGLIAFASSLDQIGPLARNVADAAAILSIIAGADPADSTSSRRSVADLASIEEPPATFRFGVPRGALGDGGGLASDVRREVDAAISALEAIGGERVDIDLPHADAAIATYYVVAAAEASSNLARFDGVRYGHRAAHPESSRDMTTRSRGEGFGPEVRRRILLGTYVLSAGYHDAYYRRANKVRWLIGRDFERAFESCAVIVTPTTPTTAFRHGEKLADPLAMYLSDTFTVPANLAGLPGMSLPCGRGDDGLPVGLQLVAPRFGEPVMLSLGRALESELARRHGRQE